MNNHEWDAYETDQGWEVHEGDILIGYFQTAEDVTIEAMKQYRTTVIGIWKRTGKGGDYVSHGARFVVNFLQEEGDE